MTALSPGPLDGGLSGSLAPLVPTERPQAAVLVPRDWLQGIWNMGNDALKRLPDDPQGALVSLTGAMMALHPLMSSASPSAGPIGGGDHG